MNWFYMVLIPIELIAYVYRTKSFIFLILISVLRGWCLIIKNIQKCFSCKYLIKKDYLFFYSNHFLLNNFYFLNSFLGLFQNFIFFLKIRGMGFKSSTIKANLILKLGYSHIILYKIEKQIQLLFINKQFFIIRGRCVFGLLELIYFFKEINKKNSYKKKGIFLKGIFFSFKVSNKKSKF